MAEELSVEVARALVEQVLEWARGDETYLASLRDDPVGVLQSAGLPESAANHVATDEFELVDVQGHMKGGGGCPRFTYMCDGFSCLVSICHMVPNTNIKEITIL